jgi:hypothetical protein
MEKLLLRDPQVLPTSEVLAEALGNSYPVFEELMTTVQGHDYGLTTDWNCYKDGKAWLAKSTYKKKTVFWLSVWDGHFKTAFYFTEKNCNGIFEMDIEESIKKDFNAQKPIGKLLPLVIEMKRKEQLADLLKIISYKKGLK